MERNVIYYVQSTVCRGTANEVMEGSVFANRFKFLATMFLLFNYKKYDDLYLYEIYMCSNCDNYHFGESLKYK
jgi:hypothetical protein